MAIPTMQASSRHALHNRHRTHLCSKISWYLSVLAHVLVFATGAAATNAAGAAAVATAAAAAAGAHDLHTLDTFGSRG